MASLSGKVLTGRAAILSGFGGPERLRLTERHWPADVADHEIIVRNLATSVNPIEWKMREGLGLPHWLWRRLLGDPAILGLDFSGEVVIAGRNSGFRPGDQVMGARPLCGAYADYLRISPSARRGAVVAKPEGISHEIAALLPFAGLVALASLAGPRGDRNLQGQRILIVGAAGGVGHLAVQIAARGLGAGHVVGICSRRNASLVLSHGAHEVITREDLTSPADLAVMRPSWEQQFDLIVDAAGLDSYFTDLASWMLKPTGWFASVALPMLSDGRPGEAAKPLEASALVARLAWRVSMGRYRFVAGLFGDLPRRAGLERLAQMLGDGNIAPHTGARFKLTEIAAAHRLSEAGGAVGKIAIAL